MKKGQFQLEAMIAFLFLAGFFAVALSSLEKQKQEAVSAGIILDAEANAQECALFADSLFSNTGSGLKKTGLECVAGKEFEIIGKKDEKEKAAFCIARQLKTTQVLGKTFLEVKTSEHYR